MHQFGLHAGKVLRAALACAALVALSACATKPSSQAPQAAEQAPAPVSTQTRVTSGPAANTTVAELQGLIRDHKVDELRTIYNANYGASMLFKPDDLTYYVVLFQQRDFWQVYKTKSIQQADAAYRTFAARTAELAQADFDRIRLQAENAKAQELLNARMARLGTLQADDALRRQQDEEVAQRQNQIYAETDRLNQQQQIARNQLTALQHQIETLQAEQNRLTGQSRAPAARKSTRASTSRTTRKTSYRRTYSYHGKKRTAAPKAAPVAAQPAQDAVQDAEQEQDAPLQQTAAPQPAAAPQQAAEPAAPQAGTQPQSTQQSSQ